MGPNRFTIQRRKRAVISSSATSRAIRATARTATDIVRTSTFTTLNGRSPQGVAIPQHAHFRHVHREGYGAHDSPGLLWSSRLDSPELTRSTLLSATHPTSPAQVRATCHIASLHLARRFDSDLSNSHQYDQSAPPTPTPPSLRHVGPTLFSPLDWPCPPTSYHPNSTIHVTSSQPASLDFPCRLASIPSVSTPQLVPGLSSPTTEVAAGTGRKSPVPAASCIRPGW